MGKPKITKTFEIKNDAVIPPSRKNNRFRKYPWNDMKVGEYISIDGSFEEKASAKTAAYAYGKRYNMKFESRVFDKNTVRIWRTK
jgi:hypothetical protein